MRFGIREIIFVLALLAMPVAAYIFVFEPRNAQIAEARHEILLKQEKLAQLEAATRSMTDLGKEIDKLSEAISIFEQKLPAEREVEVILKQVWELAAKQGLTPKSIRTDKPIINASYAELPIRMVIIGDFDGFYSFLLDLEKLRRITRMPEMKITKVRDSEGQMQASVVLSIFFEAPAQPGGAGTNGSNRL
ncbi:MAG: type 4a pilus biogenesis protein PilO [Planctomycetes bacterium]|nr:type 4a pilus biogenesis protein PilO [Planctomycetota bacterium]